MARAERSEMERRRRRVTLELRYYVLAQRPDIGFGIDSKRHSSANVNAAQLDLVAKQLPRPLKKRKQPALVLHPAIELAKESLFLGDTVVADRERHHDSRPSRLLNRAKNSTFRRKEPAAAAAGSLGVELE